MQDFNAFLSQLSTFSAEELEICSKKILQILKQNLDAPQPYADDNVCNCRRCSSDRIVKYGKDKNGKQRYKCKDCGILFVYAADLVFYREESAVAKLQMLFLCYCQCIWSNCAGDFDLQFCYEGRFDSLCAFLFYTFHTNVVYPHVFYLYYQLFTDVGMG